LSAARNEGVAMFKAPKSLRLSRTLQATPNRSICSAIPMQHADMFFSIKSHLDLVRVPLGLRRAELEAGLTRAP
jgi:hypothetical protein